MNTKSEPEQFQPAPPVEPVTRLPVPDDSLTAMARDISGLKIRIMHLQDEAARTAGVENELRGQIKRTEADRDHYHEVAIAAAALLDSINNAARHAHENMPILRSIDSVLDGAELNVANMPAVIRPVQKAAE